MRNTTVEVYTNSGLGLMTQLQYIITLEFVYIVSLAMAIMGVISNVINIKVFFTMGIDNGVTVSFLALALFDLTFLISSLPFVIALAFNVYELKFTAKFHIDPYAIFVFCINVMNINSITNVLTTAFIAVVRCLCVAKPLQFKNAITKEIAILFMAGIALFSVIIYIPILANMGMATKLDISSNTSRLSLWTSPNRNSIKNNIFILIDIFLPISTEFLVLICVVIMVRCLQAAAKFRQNAGDAITLDVEVKKKPDGNQSKLTATSNVNSNNFKLTGKDLRVVQQVVFISVVYIVCNVPKILISFTTLIEPGFTLGKRYAHVYVSLHCVRKQFEIFNAAVNLIIYYKYNTKFRSVLCL